VYVTVFASNKIHLHTTSTRRADDLYQRNRGEVILSPPLDITVSVLAPMTFSMPGHQWRSGSRAWPYTRTVLVRDCCLYCNAGPQDASKLSPAGEFDIPGVKYSVSSRDIVIGGLGWVAITPCSGDTSTIAVHTPKVSERWLQTRRGGEERRRGGCATYCSFGGRPPSSPANRIWIACAAGCACACVAAAVIVAVLLLLLLLLLLHAYVGGHCHRRCRSWQGIGVWQRLSIDRESVNVRGKGRTGAARERHVTVRPRNSNRRS